MDEEYETSDRSLYDTSIILESDVNEDLSINNSTNNEE